MSLLLSFPHDVAGDKGHVSGARVAEEGRTLSTRCGPRRASIVAAANKFVDDLVAELSR